MPRATRGLRRSYLNSAELWDEDADGVPNRYELAARCSGILPSGYAGPQAQMTLPCNPDTDGGGFLDKPAALDLVNTDPNADNCPALANPSQTNADAANVQANNAGADANGDACDADKDGDGYTDAEEQALGKDPLTYCAIMRANVDGDASVSILDITQVAFHFGQSIPPVPERYNQNSALSISIPDLTDMAIPFTQRSPPVRDVIRDPTRVIQSPVPQTGKSGTAVPGCESAQPTSTISFTCVLCALSGESRPTETGPQPILRDLRAFAVNERRAPKRIA